MTRQHPSLWHYGLKWLFGTPTQAKPKLWNNVILSERHPRPQRASWMYSWAPRELSEVSEDCAGGYMNKIPNKTRQLWPTCELQNQNQVGCHVQNDQMNTRSPCCYCRVYICLGFDSETTHLVSNKKDMWKMELSQRGRPFLFSYSSDQLESQVTTLLLCRYMP